MIMHLFSTFKCTNTMGLFFLDQFLKLMYQNSASKINPDIFVTHIFFRNVWLKKKLGRRRFKSTGPEWLTILKYNSDIVTHLLSVCNLCEFQKFLCQVAHNSKVVLWIKWRKCSFSLTLVGEGHCKLVKRSPPRAYRGQMRENRESTLLLTTGISQLSCTTTLHPSRLGHKSWFSCSFLWIAALFFPVPHRS